MTEWKETAPLRHETAHAIGGDEFDTPRKPATSSRGSMEKTGQSNSLTQIHEKFRIIAQHVSMGTGSPWAATTALLVILIWACAGPFFDYSDTWQLVINTGTTIVTFIMVFVIQNSQNRDTRELQLKLDELLRAVQGARNEFIELETLSDGQLDKLHGELETLVNEYGGAVSGTHHAVRVELENRKRQSRV